MIISFDFFGFENGAVFDTRGGHSEYYQLEAYDGLLDHLHVDRDTSIDDSTTKTEYFTYDTIMVARFNGDLEGGSLSNSGHEIEKIRFQKRKRDELYWTDVSELAYDYPNKTLYETLDKYIQNDFEYEYALLPVTNDVIGNRVISDLIRTSFDGYFLSDNDNNYRLLLDAELGSIEHVMNNSLLETLNGKYPIITYGNLDYRQGSIQAVILSTDAIHSGIYSIGIEKQERDSLLQFLKNRKPKILRGMGSELMMVVIVGSPSETQFNKVVGVSSISFDYVEIDEINSNTLRNNGLIDGLSEV